MPENASPKSVDNINKQRELIAKIDEPKKPLTPAARIRLTRQLAQMIADLPAKLISPEALHVCQREIAFMIGGGELQTARELMTQISKKLKTAPQTFPNEDRFRQGLFLTTFGDILAAELSLESARKSYQDAVKALNYPSPTGHYLLNAMLRLAGTELQIGKTAQARKTLEAVRSLVSAAFSNEINHASLENQTAAAATMLGYAWMLSGRYRDRSADLFQEALDALDKSSVPPEYSVDCITVRAAATSGLCSIRYLQGRLPEAVVLADKAVELLKDATVEYPGDLQVLALLAQTLVKRLSLCESRDDFDDHLGNYLPCENILANLTKGAGGTPQLANLTMSLNMVVGGLAIRHGIPTIFGKTPVAILKPWRALADRLTDSSFVIAECKRLCGVDLSPQGYPIIRLSDLKRDDAINGKLAVLTPQLMTIDLCDVVYGFED